jgi:hypothetical protein
VRERRKLLRPSMGQLWSVGFQRRPIRRTCSRLSVITSNPLAASSVSSIDIPVMFPPGCARLATCPSPTGSHLVLAFDARGPMSPGTARTMVRSLRLGKHGSGCAGNGVLEECRWRRGGAVSTSPGAPLQRSASPGAISPIETYAAVPRAAANRQPRAQLGAALTCIRTWSDPANPARQSRQRTLRRTVTHREIPSVGRGAQCGRRAAHSEAGDCQRVSTMMAVQYLLTDAPSGG